jgi:hypothetical protein
LTSTAAFNELPVASYRWHPAGAPKGIMQIANGMGEHARCYQDVADAFVAAGYVVGARTDRRACTRRARRSQGGACGAQHGVLRRAAVRPRRRQLDRRAGPDRDGGDRPRTGTHRRRSRRPLGVQRGLPAHAHGLRLAEPGQRPGRPVRSPTRCAASPSMPPGARRCSWAHADWPTRIV